MSQEEAFSKPVSKSVSDFFIGRNKEPALFDEAPQVRSFLLFDSVSRFLQRRAQRKPLLIAIDNLHRADTPSLYLLEYLVQAAENESLSITVTCRDTSLSGF